MVKGTHKLKKESDKAWLACGIEALGSYQVAKQCAALTVTKAKTQTWEEFNEVMEQDFLQP